MAQEMILRKIPEDMRPWECNVNGVKYVYPAGTEQEVPAEVAHLIDAWYAAQEQESVPGGGGGSGEMVVHIISNDSEPWYSADKTFADIAEAIEAEKNITAVTDYGEYLYLTIFVPGEMVSFSSTTCHMSERGTPDFGIQGLVITPETVQYFSESLEV